MTPAAGSKFMGGVLRKGTQKPIEYKAGTTIGGHKILAVQKRHVRSTAGSQTFVAYECDKCGTRAETISGAISRWIRIGKDWLCYECRYRATHDAHIYHKDDAIGLSQFKSRLKQCSVNKRREVEVQCEDCRVKFWQLAGITKRLIKEEKPVYCDKCRMANKALAAAMTSPTTTPAERSIKTFRSKLAKLPPLIRAKVLQRVKQYYDGMANVRRIKYERLIPPDQILQEAIEAEQVDARLPKSTQG